MPGPALGPQNVVDGACQVHVELSGGYSFLGWSINGVEVIEDVYMSDIPSDQNGGDLGPPVDIQYFGQIDRIRIEMSTFDPNVLDAIQPRMNGGTFGVITTPGSLIGAGGFSYGLALIPYSGLRPRHYFIAIPRQPVQRNKGTRYTRPILEFECHAAYVNGTPVLFDENVP
jgi:hypothetical protein